MDMNKYEAEVLELALQKWNEIAALNGATVEEIQAGFNCAVFCEIIQSKVRLIEGLFDKLTVSRAFMMKDLAPAGRMAYNRAMRVAGI